MPAAQDHVMAPDQRLSRECEGDSAGADRSKSHAPLLSSEKSMRTTLWHRAPGRPVSENGRLYRGDGNQGRGNRGRKAVHVAFALAAALRSAETGREVTLPAT